MSHTHSGSPEVLIVQFPAAATAGLVQVFVAFQRASLDGLTWPDGSTATSAISPATSTVGAAATHHAAAHPALKTRVPWPVVGVGSVVVITSPSRVESSPTADGPAATVVPSTGLAPVCGAAHGTCKHLLEIRHGRESHREHVVQAIISKVKSSWRTCWRLTIRRREVTIGIGVCSRRRDVSRINHVRID